MDWLPDFEHDSLAEPEARESFTKTMSKYGSQEDAIIGGYEAIKQVGRPFKLPESLDKLPDDKTRAELQAGIHKLMGVIESEDAIPAGFNWKEGMAEGIEPDANFIGAAKKLAIESHWTAAQLKSAVVWANTLGANYRKQLEQTANAEMAETNKKLLEAYNGDEKARDVDIELMRRTFQNHAGLSGEEFEQIAEDLMGPDQTGKMGAILRKPVLAKAMLKLLAPMSKEGGSETGEGGLRTEKPKTKEETVAAELPGMAERHGWKK